MSSRYVLAARLLSLALGALVFTACASPVWVADGRPQTAPKIGVTSDLPEGWSRFTRDRDLIYTRDGLLLQSIRISRVAYETKVPGSDRTITRGMEPLEASQVVVDALQADTDKHQLRILDTRPATVDGREGHRLEFSFRTPDGLTIHEVRYVVFLEDSYVVAVFTAPERHYFEQHAGTFERVVESLRIAPDPPRRS